MSRRLWISREVREWLTRLRADDPRAARLAGEALLALVDGTPGPPLVVPVDPARWAADPAMVLDYAYQRRLVLMQRVRRAAADIATSRRRLELQIAQLEASVRRSGERIAAADENGRPDLAQRLREGQAGLEDTLAELRREYPELERAERDAIAAGRRLQLQTDLWRVRKEKIKAAHSSAMARELIGHALAETGEAETRAFEGGKVTVVPELQELRLGALTGRDLRVLFTVEQPAAVLLLTAGEGPTVGRALRAAYDPGFFDGERTAESFLEEFFPGEEDDRRAGAARFADRSGVHALADVRLRAGLSVERAAERMGTTPDVVAAIERDGPDAVETGTLAAYLTALGGRLEVVADLGSERLRLL
jgi:hypothetical protein